MLWVRYLAVIGAVGLVALSTVCEHVEATRLAYEARELEVERARLVEDTKASRLRYEQASAPERLQERALALGVVSEAELSALTGAPE
ncbi:MAG: hypothetical protein KDD82_22000 [Planctomycetes bacterium]|nr:hypothetical protein [Planctomycetota bacterium]